MTARIAGFVSRAQCGLRAPRNRNTSVRPAAGGTAVHWGGPGKAPTTLDAAIKMWRSWQALHMRAPRSWADIAYSVGVTQTGHVLAGRGYGVRTAAQGTNDGNARFLAVVWLGGEDSEPTQAALDAIEWVVADFQDKGAGLAVRSHRRFHSTSCAGPRLTKLAESLDGRRIRKASTAAPAPKPTAPIAPAKPAPRPPAGKAPLPQLGAFTPKVGLSRARNSAARHGGVEKAQRNLAILGLYRLASDQPGRFGDDTERAVKELQRRRGLAVDGVIGPRTWAALQVWS